MVQLVWHGKQMMNLMEMIKMTRECNLRSAVVVKSQKHGPARATAPQRER